MQDWLNQQVKGTPSFHPFSSGDSVSYGIKITIEPPFCRYSTPNFAGEYAMIKAAAMQGWLDERETVLEALMCMRRAGSDLILSYYASDAAKWMAGEK